MLFVDNDTEYAGERVGVSEREREIESKREKKNERMSRKGRGREGEKEGRVVRLQVDGCIWRYICRWLR